VQSPAVTYLHEIVGADAVIAGTASTISGVRAIGRYKLQIRTTRPVNDLAARLTMPFFCPIPADLASDTNELDTPPGSGPYFIATRVRDKVIVLERNRWYTGPRPANVDRVDWEIGQQPEECRLATERDEVDYCETRIPSDEYRELADRYGINKSDGQFFVNRTLSLFYFAFNHDRPTFKGPGQIPLKQAINWTIDRPALARSSGFLVLKRTDQILPPGLGRDEHIYPLTGVTDRSLAKARELFAKAKHKPDKLILYALQCGNCARGAETFQYDMQQLGIDVDIEYFSNDTLFAKAGTRGEPFDVLATMWGADYPDPVTFFEPLLDGTGIRQTGNTNYAYFDRARYNREIQRISGITGEERLAQWADLDAELMRNDPPFAPFANGSQRDFVSKSFGCYVFQPVIGKLDLAAACKR
jgi:ABC-type oligopeptide transport system substrate-binding subunit